MKVNEIIEAIFEYGKDFNYITTCDTIKIGCGEAEVKKVAVAMNPTVKVIKEASNWGADLLIVHEPLYFNHMDEHSDEAVEVAKRDFLESTGMTVVRFHDHPHRAYPDMIALGEFRKMELDGEINYTHEFDLARVKMNSPVTPKELAKHIEEKLGIKHIRIAGCANEKCTNISAMFGAPGDVMNEFTNPETEILLIGETCEWRLCEYARDAAELGVKKAALVLGHVGSERAGMEYIFHCFKEKLPQLEFKYIDTDEVFTYTDC